MIATLLLAASVAAVPSTSKLGVRFAGEDPTAGALLGAAACPRIAVFAASDGAAAAQIDEYDVACPPGVTIAQVGTDGAGAAGAQLTIGTWLSTVPARVSAVEAPAVSGTPAEIAAFWTAFISSVPAGKLPVLRLTADSPCPPPGAFWWSWRARSPMSQGSDDVATTLGYRDVVARCPELLGTELVLTDIAPAGRSWRASDDAWLRWFDARLAEDAYAQGAALASAGDGTLAAVKDALLALLANPALPDGGTDGGADAGGGGIVTPHPGTDGELVPVKTKGCSSGASGGAVLAILPLLFALRRWSRARR